MAVAREQVRAQSGPAACRTNRSSGPARNETTGSPSQAYEGVLRSLEGWPGLGVLRRDPRQDGRRGAGGGDPAAPHPRARAAARSPSGRPSPTGSRTSARSASCGRRGGSGSTRSSRRRSSSRWPTDLTSSPRWDSNPRPDAYKAPALPAELLGRRPRFCLVTTARPDALRAPRMLDSRGVGDKAARDDAHRS